MNYKFFNALLKTDHHMRWIVSGFLLTLAVCITGCSSKATRTEPVRHDQSVVDSTRAHVSSAPAKKVDWADATLARLTLEEKVSQLVFVWTLSRYYPQDAEHWQELERLVSKRKLGGIIFSIGDVYDYGVQINKLQRLSDVPLLMTADFEWGAGMRIKNAATFPRPMALGATRDPSLAYRMGKAVAEEMRALGVHQNYAPVVDVNNNPKNPVINTRSFGDNPALVSAMGTAFIRGTQDGGVIATAKHFPGHGDTDIDTHLDMPTMGMTRERFDSVELPPFRDAIRAGVMSMMIGHLSVPAFDSLPGIPGTVSSRITSRLLKDELGFTGLVVTDAMVMKAMSDKYSTGDAAVMALKAGIDAVLMPPSADTAITAIVDAVRKGELSEERIDVSVKKILRLKQWCGLDTNRYIDVDKISSAVASAPHLDLVQEIARKSVTVLGNKNGIIPLRLDDKNKIIEVIFADNDDPNDGRNLHSEIKRRHNGISLLRIDPRSNRLDYDSVYQRSEKADMLILQFRYYTRSGEMSGFLPPRVVQLVNKILALKKPTVGISVGNPYIVSDFPAIENYICTYSGSEASEAAAAEVLFGEQPARGRLPITIPGMYRYGDGYQSETDIVHEGLPEDAGFDSKKLSQVDTVIDEAIRDSVFPGTVLLVAKEGAIVHQKAYGKFEYCRNSTPVTAATMYDLASVTKIIATTSAVMRLCDEGLIDLQAPVAKYLPAFAQNGKDKITVYNLMVHNSGLPGWRKFYTFCQSPQCVLDSLYATGLVYRTGDSTVYSDLGFITMGKVIEKVTGTSLEKYVDSVFFRPLGMSSTMYNPPATLLGRIAPTEIDSTWKKTYQPVHGRVHDENAATLGGVSGHAGLFSTASDLAVMLQMELNGGVYRGIRYIKEETIKLFTKRQSEKSTRGIGWDTKNLNGSWSGKLISSKTFLHTGFTGTSIAVDPERKLIVIFLTNRVYPTRANTRIYDIRPKVHDAIIAALR